MATANNAPQYFDNDLFEPRFQWRMNMPDVNGLWNPRGPGTLRLVDVRVTSVCRPDGTELTDTRADPVVGGRLADDDLRTNAKMVDLDPANQMVPEIYGWRPRLLDRDGREVLRGDYLPSAVEDLWPRADLPSGRPDMSGTYQSVLTSLTWAARGHRRLPATGPRVEDQAERDVLGPQVGRCGLDQPGWHGAGHAPDSAVPERVKGHHRPRQMPTNLIRDQDPDHTRTIAPPTALTASIAAGQRHHEPCTTSRRRNCGQFRRPTPDPGPCHAAYSPRSLR
ncbi:hypothetical protein AB0B15_34170 [Streptomyces sp. NPDC045456]|uniref:hypothetical protein n=1 Tax=Streptomyces sp. NPDC045456 TaxID=3155254 RepID=UPI0033F99F47